MTSLKERYKNLKENAAKQRRDVSEKAKQSRKNLKEFFATSGRATYASMFFMGAGQIVNGQYIKGFIYILLEVGFITYFALRGIKDLFGFFTLGTVKADPWLGIKGDDSVIMLLMGIFAWIALIALIIVYVANIKDAHRGAEDLLFKGKVSSFKDDLSSLMNRNFYKAALVIPILGVMIFNVLPIIFMILIAFTNYGGKIVPPNWWIGVLIVSENWLRLATYRNRLAKYSGGTYFGRFCQRSSIISSDSDLQFCTIKNA